MLQHGAVFLPAILSPTVTLLLLIYVIWYMWHSGHTISCFKTENVVFMRWWLAIRIITVKYWMDLGEWKIYLEKIRVCEGCMDRLTDRSNLTDCIRTEKLATETHVLKTRIYYKRNKISIWFYVTIIWSILLEKQNYIKMKIAKQDTKLRTINLWVS